MRIHNSHVPLILDAKRKYKPNRSFQPNGLWYSFGPSWVNFYKESLSETVGRYNSLVSLGERANILQINYNNELIKFHCQYANRSHDFAGIQWDKVMADFDGIEIAPSHTISDNLLMRGYLWCSEWIFPSGCIWNLTHVNVRPTTRQEIVHIFR